MTGVILFRAQPFHNGHLCMVEKAFKDSRENGGDLHIFVGSADKSGTKRNPIPVDFRLMLIKGSLSEVFTSDELKHIHIHPLNDLTDEADNSHSWGRYLFMQMLGETRDMDMTIYYSDNPQIMLSWFSAEDRWCLRFKFLDRYKGISATMVRKVMCDLDLSNEYLERLVPNFVLMHREEIIKYLEEAK